MGPVAGPVCLPDMLSQDTPGISAHAKGSQALTTSPASIPGKVAQRVCGFHHGPGLRRGLLPFTSPKENRGWKFEGNAQEAVACLVPMKVAGCQSYWALEWAPHVLWT
jgi:hypothetical protein